MNPRATKGSVRILSLGAGVQSSALLLLADEGKIPRPDYAIFADTQSEPEEVYSWLEFLSVQVSIPVLKATKGNLADDVLKACQTSGRFAVVPFFVLNPDGTQGLGKRQCTSNYKIEVVYQALRMELGYNPRQWFRHHCFTQLGISTDEPERIKPSRKKWITNEYPLIELGWNREGCKRYVADRVGREPPRSACWMCPYRSDDEWIYMRDHQPEAWKKAVEFDRGIRVQKKFRGQNFVHRSMKPLAEVELVPGRGRNQFANECEGMCGN